MLYQEELMDHYKYPRNHKTITSPDFAISELNPSCGDRIAIEGKISDDSISDLGFSGSGCVISQATASMLTEHCIGKKVDIALTLSKNDIIAMVGLEMGPTRLKCALLSLQVLQHGLLSLQAKK